ncbi:hypothetical protein BD324DRAFT_127122 [Kockovaella imperatae]|uniref:Bud emergence protein 1 n=1 Tax=Kockovaella imperatae TaxID=4999 RepID=A0A1Y1U9J9_9TREE|nr:hypothetical protein BD324DRAFT_127122 [Kockovaella imperatae]ORX34692.1 hypothetical protein BD324DRAFT_127122 [Kockovaella imperatae]
MPMSAPSAPGPRGPPGKQPIYAVVIYDFQAERPDELDAKKGEPIMVIAQSNHEWFVAKPIGRLGGPGLIPVAFVEIRDPATGKPVHVEPDAIPMVEEWKKATAEYKAAAIPLGRFDLEQQQPVQQQPSQQQASTALPPRSSSTIPPSRSQSNLGHSGSGSGGSGGTGRPRPHYRPEQDLMFPPGDLTALSVPSFHNESGNYWFRLHVTFLPDETSAPAYTLSLYRTYEDFYDFQISLLDTFPFEAGRPRNSGEVPPERILPYMPGPVDDEVDDELTEYRREELDMYVKALLDLKSRGGSYIIRNELLRTFFAAKSGDYCEEISRSDVMGDLEERLAETRIDDKRPSNGQAASSQGHGRQPSYDRYASSSSNDHRAPSAASLRSASGGGGGGGGGVGGPAGGISPMTSSSRPASGDPGPSTGTTSSSFGNNSQPAYVKIKIYDRSTDDLIALRVHPHVTHAELFEKVRARLGPDIKVLKCRTTMAMPDGGQYREIGNDRELREWMRTEDQKMVLYAE